MYITEMPLINLFIKVKGCRSHPKFYHCSIIIIQVRPISYTQWPIHTLGYKPFIVETPINSSRPPLDARNFIPNKMTKDKPVNFTTEECDNCGLVHAFLLYYSFACFPGFFDDFVNWFSPVVVEKADFEVDLMFAVSLLSFLQLVFFCVFFACLDLREFLRQRWS